MVLIVADIAREGVGPSPGYSGGWGILFMKINMKSRDVTIFDGYTECTTGTGSIPISGFSNHCRSGKYGNHC
jgi:hypothetical protein